MSLQDTLQSLVGDKGVYEIARAYALAKDGKPPARSDKYALAVARVLENPDTAQWKTLKVLFETLGVDAEAAIAAAASQVTR